MQSAAQASRLCASVPLIAEGHTGGTPVPRGAFIDGTRPIAIVTGATAPGRVGRAIARELARRGCDVVLTHRPDAPESAGLEAVSLVEAAGGRAILESLELSDPASAEVWTRGLAARLPRVDVLVHNAAEYVATPTESVAAATVERLFRVNALSPMLISKALFKGLAMSTLSGGGAIVTLGDIHAMGPTGQPRKGYIGYSMSKAALQEMTLVLAREMAPRVRVNAAALGVAAFAPGEDEAFQSRYLSRVPLGRAGTPEDAAKAVAWLALDAAYCTGQVVRVDGGRGLG